MIMTELFTKKGMSLLLTVAIGLSLGGNATAAPVSPLPVCKGAPAQKGKTQRAPFKGAPVNIAGSIVYSGTDRPVGLYSFATDAKELTPIAEGDRYNASKGGVMAGSRYFCAYQKDYWGVMQENYHYLFDSTSWQTLKETDNAAETNLATALAYDPVSKKVYGCFYGENGGEFAVFDIYTFQRGDAICSVPNVYEAMGFTSQGQLYAIDRKANLLKIDKNSGASTVVGNTGIGIKYVTSGGIDTRTDRFFFAACNDTEKAIYQIDLSTGAATYVCDTPEDCEITGMWFPEPLAKDDAPAAVSDMNVNFNEAGLSGTVTFTSPVTLYDGSAASGPLTYTVKGNGATLATGETSCGANVSAQVTVPSDGVWKITVAVANAKGTGPEAYKTLYIGKDTPSRVGNVTLTRNGNWNTVTWEKVTTMVHGGWINPAQVTYTITRFPDNVVVKENEKNLKFQEYIDKTSNGEPCYYEVSAVFNGVKGESRKSNSFALGVLNVPFTEAFTSRNDFNKWLSVDVNGYGRDWDWGGSTDQNAFCYNSTREGVPMNAWLISPGIWMEAGREYTLAFDVHSNNDGITEERLEVAYGKEASPEGMTNTLIEPMIVNYKAYKNHEVKFSVPENGIYYVGFHGCSDPKTYFIFLDNVSMTASEPANTAMEPELKVTPDAAGGLRAVVELTLPVLNTSGETLESLEKVVVKRGETTIKESLNPKPGDKVSFLDEVTAEGYYEYTAAAYTAAGVGKPAARNVYIGVNTPGAPEYVKASNGSAPGKVRLSWKAVDKTSEGLPASPELMTYNVYDSDGKKLKENVKGTSVEIDVEVPAQGQVFKCFAVRAVTKKGEGTAFTQTEKFPVGEAYAMPVAESFGNSKKIALALGNGSEGEWGFAASINTPACTSQDEDGGMLVWVPSGENTSASIFSGKIKVDAEAGTPRFSFYYFGVASADVILPLVVDLATGDVMSAGDVIELKSGDGWTKASLPLDAYKGREIQIGFKVTSKTYNYIICLDNVRVLDQKNKDMGVVRVNVPEVMMVNTPSEITVDVENIGQEVARGYTVELYRNGSRIAESNPGTLGVDVPGHLTFTETPDATYPDELEYHAVVKLDGDENSANDESAAATTRVGYISLPTVTDLKALRYDGSTDVRLKWSEVNAGSEIDEVISESFETASDFSTVYGDWTFVDKDGQRTYGIEGMPFPGSGEPMAYIVMNDRHESFNTTFAASHGHKYLAAFCPAAGNNDDWAISPLLSGNKQTVTFDAKTYMEQTGKEVFEFLYSTTGKETSDFKLLRTEHVPGVWTNYSIEVPQGTRYFAVRCITNQGFIFMIDNFRFEVRKDLTGVSVVGYNIYRDNVRLNNAPVSADSFDDKGVLGDDHIYRASVVYSTGESRKGNEATITDASGVGAIEGPECGLTVLNDGIAVTCSADCRYTVVNTEGIVVANGLATAGTTKVNLASGIYVVRLADNKTFTVMVR